MKTMMNGNLLDPGKAKQRAIFLLKGVRHWIGWALEHNPAEDELADYEARMTIGRTRTFEAHGEDEALLALVISAFRFIEDPDTIRRAKGGRSSIERAEAKEATKALLRAAY